MHYGKKDIELWTASMNGDRKAFGELFGRFYSLLFQYGSKICSDSTVLEDCIQELFIELWQKQPAEPLQSVKAYLLQSLKFKLYRSFRAQRFTTGMEQADNTSFELSHETFIINQEADREKIKAVLDAMNGLSPRQKEVIYLKIYKGLNYEEISIVMRINYQVVRNLLCQALKALRKLVIPLFAAAFMLFD